MKKFELHTLRNIGRKSERKKGLNKEIKGKMNKGKERKKEILELVKRR